MTFYDAFVWAFLSLATGLVAGYVIGWNRAKHPGKVEAQVQSVIDKAKDATK